MRRYKCIDITNTGFIERCIYLWLDGKKSRVDVQRFLSRYTGLTYRQVCKMLRIGVTDWLPDCVKNIAKDVQKQLIEKKLNLQRLNLRISMMMYAVNGGALEYRNPCIRFLITSL